MLAALASTLVLNAATPDIKPANYDESKVPAHVLPDALRCENGEPVRDAAAWQTKRRAELLELFSREIYGRTPSAEALAARGIKPRWETTSVVRDALGGKATRKQITVWFTENPDGPKMQILIYQPNAIPAATPARPGKRWPVFLGLNFAGNHTVNAEPGIPVTTSWMRNNDKIGHVNNRASEKSRGSSASRWHVERVIERGYATATAYYGDICPDHAEGLADPSCVAAVFAPGKSGSETRANDAWGAAGAWAWGLSRALDVIIADPELDGARVIVHGHSRLGKAAVWAAAQDTRFAMLISNNSGCMGAALSMRAFGETVARINRSFPHWFAKNLRAYNDNESALPVDQHELLALVAPRPLYVASAVEDRWADPRGEFLAAKGAESVYALFGKKGLGVSAREMPAPNRPVGDTIRYHIRDGKHDITEYDWEQYLDFADKQLR